LADTRQFQDKLDATRASIKAVTRTDEFGIADTTQQSKDPTFYDPYKSNHKSSVRCSVFFGPIWISEIVGIEHREENSKTPVYHYASQYFDDILEGKYIVRGNLYVFETKTNELLATIAKYKTLLAKENYQRELIKDIVSQRNNLLAADINVRLLSKYGPTEAARIVDQSLKRINTEIITGRDWDLPKLIIVSGDITDPEPAIDVFEDVTFDTSSKAILADGATQIRVISWFGRRRPIRDNPETGSLLGKKRIDFDATVRNFMDSFMNFLKSNMKVLIKDVSIPVALNPNNIGFIGSLPPAIAGWGPELCLTPVKVEQYGVPDIIPLQYNTVYYEIDSPAETAENIIKENKPYQYREYKRGEIPTRTTLRGVWKNLFPDPDFLIANTPFISRALPTHRALSYSWLIPVPAMPGTVGDSFGQDPLLPARIKNSGDYTFQEEDTHSVTGSTLMAAFMTVAMYRDYDERTGGFIRAPVRSMFYMPIPTIKTEDLDDKTKRVLIEDYPLIQQGDFLSIIENRISLPDEYSSLVPLKQTFDGSYVKVAKSATPTASKVSPIDLVSKYEAEAWYLLTPLGPLDIIFGASSFLSNVFETVTLGILSNSDKVVNYEIDLQDDFGKVAYGFAVDSVIVQVFPLGLDELIANSTIGELSLAFGSHAKVNRAIAASLLDGCECVSNEEIDYIYSIVGFNETGFNKVLNFSATWNKDTIARLLRDKKLPGMLVRIVSDRVRDLGGRFTQVIGRNDYVSAATTMPSSKVVYTSFIRCDRSYFTFDERWPKDIFTTLANVSANAGLNFYRRETDIAIRLFAGSLRALKHDGVWQALTFNIIQGGGTALTLGGIGLAASGIGLAAKTIGIFGSAALDTAEGIWNLAIHVPIINEAVNILDSIGLDLTTIFQDTTIVRSSRTGGETPVPSTALKNISVYNNGERYIVFKDRLAEYLSRIIYNDVKEIISANPDEYEGDEVLANGGTSVGGAVYNRVDTQLVDGFNRYFKSPEWSVDYIYGEDLDKLVGGITSETGEPLLSNAGSKTSEVFLLTRKAPRPSMFVLDEAVKDPNAYRGQDPNPRGIIF
jgi:hypothetical protein